MRVMAACAHGVPKEAAAGGAGTGAGAGVDMGHQPDSDAGVTWRALSMRPHLGRPGVGMRLPAAAVAAVGAVPRLLGARRLARVRVRRLPADVDSTGFIGRQHRVATV